MQVALFQPAEPFAMRAIRQNADQIVALRPADERARAVEQIIGAGKIPHGGRIALDHDARQHVHRGQLRRTRRGSQCHLQIAAAVVEKLGHPCFRAGAGQGVLPIGAAAAHRGAVHRAIRVEQFRRRYLNHRTCLPMSRQNGNQRRVLSQIINNGAAGKDVGPDGLQGLRGDDRGSRMGLSAQASAGTVRHRHRRPGRGIEAGLVPPGLHEPGIIVLAAVNVRVSNGTGGRLPLGVGGNDLAGAIGVKQIDLCDHFGRTEGTGKLGVSRRGLNVIHAIAQQHAHGIVAVGQI